MRIFYLDREERLVDDSTEVRKNKSIIHDVSDTHIITAVSFGIDVVIILQLPSAENTAGKIDAALWKIRTRLMNPNENPDFTTDDADVLKKIIETKVYSNVTELTKMTSLLEVCQFIDGSKQKRDTYRPVEYTLRPMEWLFAEANKSCPSYTPLDDNDKLEQHLIEILNYYKKVKYLLDSCTTRVLPNNVKDSLVEAEKEWHNLQEVYENEIKRLATLVLDIHSGQKNASEIDEALKHKDQTAFKENIRELLKKIPVIEKETQLTNSAPQEQPKYSELLEPQTNPNDHGQTLTYKPTMENQPNKTICANDNSFNKNQSIILTEQENERNGNSQYSSSLPTKTQASNASRASLSASSTNEIINILLVGESGVGKSTFINAFVNYLTFKTFNEAEQGKPVVLIPVSFLMTVGKDFEEHTVKFGNSDSYNNEDFDHPGQSVTQHCKSYIFHLNDINKKKLRIIDTPGFGDTRGSDQDDANMQHILEYINELTHLNAICFLLKPNTSQINSFFVTCLTQLLDLLGSNARQNIVFCFTNARSTFYTPGDTAPLLKSILQSFSLNDISFKKQNTFCFDNESLRYLVARQNGIQFNDEQHNEYENSWSNSVTESNRLLDYVYKELSVHVLKGEAQSIKQTQFKISHMIRPMLEAMRNILRNSIIWNMDAPKKSIELNPIVLYRSAAVCYTCQRDVVQLGKFWVVLYYFGGQHRLISYMARKQIIGDNNESELVLINRTAIYPDGCIGSLYDGYRDILYEKLPWNNEDKLIKVVKKPQCILKKGKKDQNETFLQVVNIPKELRLSILLRLSDMNGIASIINYPYPVNEYTRFLLYSYIYEEEQASEKPNKTQKMIKSAPISGAATHIITGISYGIDVVVVLQLPFENSVVTEIDDVLQRICIHLNHEQNALVLNLDDENALEQIMGTMIYSNISSLTELSTVREVYLYIDDNKNDSIHCPIMYTLRPIKWMFPNNNHLGAKFNSMSSALNIEVEKYLTYLSTRLKNLKYSLDSSHNGLLYKYLEGQIRGKQRQWLLLSEIYEHIIGRLQKWIIDVRKNRPSVSKKDQLFNHEDHAKFEQSAQTLQEYSDGFQKKERLINDLKNQYFEYCNVAELNLHKHNYKKTLECKLKTKDRNHKILCTNDKLNKEKGQKIDLQRNQLAKEHEKNDNLCITYADFSYSSVELQDIEILTISQTNNNKKENHSKKLSSTATQNKTTTLQRLSSSPITNDNINILLLGETGVGKSTFINAFVNYLKFKTFEQAQSNTPVVLIPVSFLMTVGDNFEERLVKFGDIDSSNNEDFDHPGESVTQHCRTYEFHLGDNDEKKLCIIDTPGFGDTRGLDQDDVNMQDILEYINNLTHLNAVCFLLKPNTSELHTFFRICFMQLLDLLGPNAHQNIIFCFTNARSTFYTPGDTAPLLKILLKSFSMNDIPFKKDNTFCFDNESFRYLVALQNEIEFNDDEKHDYKESWSTSVKESNRLIDYIHENLIAYRSNNEWKTIKRAHIEISHMIRPMLETIHNILRNIILCKMNIRNKSITMFPKAIHRSASICLSCKPYPRYIGNFWISRDIPHEFLKKCLVCPCNIEQHITIHYVLNYECSKESVSNQRKEMTDMVNQLCIAGAEFDYFLVHIAHASKDYLFLSGFMRMIDEETKLCQSQKPNHLNLQLIKEFTQLKCQYESRIEELKSNQRLTDLSFIDKRITVIREYPLIKTQLDIMKQTQNMMTEPYEVS
ncbi:unnamed protein product [Rotaria sp. Silwood2]|nr:unnamed protein product [Rotaria sp. Silwood2]CAF4000717.1 unnamed protein product [Rotaria sp. Silwood2]